MADSSVPRENLIATAVKFLQNPKVRESPFAQRRNFLAKKGLTDEEIDIAVERSGTSKDEVEQQAPSEVNQSQLVPSTIGPLAPNQSVQTVSKWTQVRDVASSAIVIGGVTYAVYILFKRYIAPHWFKPSKQEQQLEQLIRSITELQQSVADTVRVVEETQRMLSQQQENLQQVASDTAASRGSKELLNMQSNQFVNEIKEEIKSLKGLLLNKRQFPPAPVTTPMIPSWQLNTTQSETSSQSATNTQADVTDRSDTQAADVHQSSSGDTETTKKTLAGNVDSDHTGVVNGDLQTSEKNISTVQEKVSVIQESGHLLNEQLPGEADLQTHDVNENKLQ